MTTRTPTARPRKPKSDPDRAIPRVLARKITATSPGEPVIIDGQAVATIWSGGPRPTTVWALTDSGEARVYSTPTAKNPVFADTGCTVPAPTPLWQALLNMAIAGRPLYVYQRSRRASATTAVLEYEVVSHAHGCDLIDMSVADDLADLYSTTKVGGVAFLSWLHGGHGAVEFGMYAPPALTRTLKGRFCDCTGLAHLAEQVPAETDEALAAAA